MDSGKGYYRRPTQREKTRRERIQDLKCFAFITVMVGVASLVFIDYARDIWAVYVAIIGLLILAVSTVRLIEIFGWIAPPAWSPAYWSRGVGSGMFSTWLWYMIGFGLLFFASRLSERMSRIFTEFVNGF